ncbi:MAG: DUF4365 domain-containing protein [Acidobacteria bacterium]|nr:DUF4365 domain-containing protein [Acidobacteriota bacterium]
MIEAILSDHNRKAAMSHAYVSALAAEAGLSLQPGPDPDIDSVDATIRSGSPERDVIDLQLKATAAPEVKSDGLHFRLKQKNYNDMVMPRAVPLLLVVLELPSNESEWMDCTPERLIIKKCGWWLSLAGREPVDSDSRTVVIPRSQRIGSTGLSPLFARALEVQS